MRERPGQHWLWSKLDSRQPAWTTCTSSSMILVVVTTTSTFSRMVALRPLTACFMSQVQHKFFAHAVPKLMSHVRCKRISFSILPFKLRLCVGTILRARCGECVVLLGMKCSSWTVVNLGTSKRAPCCPAGDLTQPSVRMANCMAARTFVPCAIAWVMNLIFLNLWVDVNYWISRIHGNMITAGQSCYACWC